MMPTLKPDGAKALQAALEDAAASLPGCSLAVANASGVLFSGYTGWFDPMDQSADARRWAADDIMWFASTTKLLTAICYLQLVDRGFLTLDTDMCELYSPLKEAASQILTGFDDAGKPKFKANDKPVTLRSLLNQTSGFGREFGDTVAAWKKVTDKGKGFVNSCLTHKENLIHTPICFEPGSWWEYGNSAEWLGLMLPEFVNQSTEDYMQDNLVKPLGMKGTTFFPFDGEQAKRLLPTRWRAEKEDGTVEWQVLGGQMDLLTLPRTRKEIEYPVAGGGIYSSSSDYILVLQHLLQHYLSLADSSVPAPATPLLSNASVKSIFEPSLPEPAKKPMAEMLSWYFGDTSGTRYQAGDADWTTAVAVYCPANGEPRSGFGRRAGSVGWGGAAGTQYWMDPKTGIAAVFTTQMVPGSGPATTAFKDLLERAIYEAIDLKDGE